MALFVIVLIAASLCAVASGIVLVVAWSSNGAELGMVAAFAMSVSVLPLVHGLTTPGVLYGPNAATMSSVMLALPWASVAVAPLVAPRSSFGRWVSRRWKPWVFTHVAMLFGLAAGLLARPSLFPAPQLGAASSIVVACLSLAVCFALSVRHLRLSWISGSVRPVMVAVGFAFIGASSLVWVARAPFTAGFWVAHLFDIVGVFGLTIGAFIAYRQQRTFTEIVRPLVANEPLSAFELGLEPLVHRFVAMLETKDAITRDHVVRTAAHAIRVGDHLRLPGADIHRLGLAALLHDLGKLSVPDKILNKAGRLDAEEFEIVKGHTIAGQALVEQSSVLVSIGTIVRGHHERIDGGGYPDGLSGNDIPFLARIVSVCDAYDAMAFTRQYREGLGHARAIGVLQEHAGSQWDESIVAAVVGCLAEPTSDHSPLDSVGRGVALDDFDRTSWCSCGDAVPNGLVVLPIAAALSQPVSSP
ncbi:MAG: HD-GYP domain-containing protein [Ilumatobacteraceae bacterium]